MFFTFCEKGRSTFRKKCASMFFTIQINRVGGGYDPESSKKKENTKIGGIRIRFTLF